jgi:hypothetical protein
MPKITLARAKVLAHIRIMSNSTPSLIRAQWLEDAAEALRDQFISKGYTVPANVRWSMGWPKGSHGRNRTMGQCWSALASQDRHFEICLTPLLGTKHTMEIIGTLAHELVHATVGTEAGHKGPFKRCAIAIGLTGKMTATTGGPSFKAWAEPLIARIGNFPSGALMDAPPGYKPQSTRLIKCECAACGYVARVSRKWIDDPGPPICPRDEIEMEET